jgi:ABC-2 type transport system permease protein
MKIILATFRTALLEAWTNRKSFWFQVTIMITNDIAWVIFWVLFFHKIGSIRGWDQQRILLLFSIITTVAGIALGLLANARKIGELIADGQIDAALTLPVHPLAYLLVRRIDTAMVGDLFFGPVLFVLSGTPTVERTLVYIVGSICGAIVLVGFLVALGALTMFVGGRGEQADLGFQAILILASYPLDVFGGLTKLILFTAIPAAFVSGLPTRLVGDFSLPTAAAVGGSAAFFFVLAAVTFSMGLRRYTSGALWTRA